MPVQQQHDRRMASGIPLTPYQGNKYNSNNWTSNISQVSTCRRRRRALMFRVFPPNTLALPAPFNATSWTWSGFSLHTPIKIRGSRISVNKEHSYIMYTVSIDAPSSTQRQSQQHTSADPNSSVLQYPTAISRACSLLLPFARDHFIYAHRRCVAPGHSRGHHFHHSIRLHVRMATIEEPSLSLSGYGRHNIPHADPILVAHIDHVWTHVHTQTIDCRKCR
ncbi:hypothetical protein JB92DRAFT_2034017 [Gautieria morchelliformis]|nr:hypothetical protein JB92DRAFT_2034017 [Gautieria morchelliformis]